ncbi:MAG TPA: hypothetical protein DCX14_09450 [Flavobacteriales bacterium]|jgi:nucleoid-associated protein EbfC|nr:hypothetical protein [Flavobacteriales bacterium]
MFDMMKKLQEAQRQMKEIKDRLETIYVSGKSNNGSITVTSNGNRKITGIDFASDYQNQNDPEFKMEMVSAINDALDKANTVNESEMKSAASTMMPGMGGLFK